MTIMHFEWDESKSYKNKEKHGVSFNEAKSVFFDENALLIYDPDHSEDEDRFILLGMSTNLRILVVCHCCRDEDNVVRLISARKADRSESSAYNRR